MSEKSFLVREPRLRSEDTYLISPQDLTNRRLKRSNVAKPTPRRPSPYPPVVKKKPAKMVTRSPPAKAPKANRPTLMDNDSDIPGGLQLALIAPADPSGGAAGGLPPGPPALPTPFPPVDPLQSVKTDPPGAGALDPAGGAKKKTGNGNGRNGNGQKTQEEIEKERAAREAELQRDQERAERMRMREEKAEQERLARLRKQRITERPGKGREDENERRES